MRAGMGRPADTAGMTKTTDARDATDTAGTTNTAGTTYSPDSDNPTNGNCPVS